MKAVIKQPSSKPAAAITGATAVAFGVVFIEKAKMYIPTRFELVDGKVVHEKQIAPAGPYKPLAYQYLSGAVMEFYNSVNLKEAHALAKAEKSK